MQLLHGRGGLGGLLLLGLRQQAPQRLGLRLRADRVGPGRGHVAGEQQGDALGRELHRVRHLEDVHAHKHGLQHLHGRARVQRQEARQGRRQRPSARLEHPGARRQALVVAQAADPDSGDGHAGSVLARLLAQLGVAAALDAGEHVPIEAEPWLGRLGLQYLLEPVARANHRAAQPAQRGDLQGHVLPRRGHDVHAHRALDAE
mmetsp:Transcript_65544/g.170619  ORF Transcript_65544/g.170619 Transcript_65544/m.170619 type:complete len:203 (-) Transcript_65544:498-1106(-)